MKSSRIWLQMALAGSLATPVLHLLVLVLSGRDPVVTPISALSRSEWSVFHAVGLTAFGWAHLSLAIGLGGMDHGKLWPYARAFLAASGLLLFYVAYYFQSASESALAGSNANDPLWLVASLTGLAMGALQPGLWRLARRLGLFCTFCLGAWLWLIPLILLVNSSWLGAYERIVGTVYVVWMVGVSLGLITVVNNHSRSAAVE